jgi:signal transduction histidine kinase
MSDVAPRLSPPRRGSTSTEAVFRKLLHDLASATEPATVARRSAEAALEITQSRGAYVEQVLSPDEHVEIIAVAGEGPPPLATRADYPGSLTDELIQRGAPEVIMNVEGIGDAMAAHLARSCADCSVLVVPLRASTELLGALVLLRPHDDDPFQAEDIDRAVMVGDATCIAMQRLRAIARERHRRDAEASDIALRRSERRHTILADTGQLLEASLGFQATLDRLAHLLVQWICDWCVISLPVADGARRAALAGREPDTEALARHVVGEVNPESVDTPTMRVLRTGRSLLLHEVPSNVIDAVGATSPALARLLAEHRPRSQMNVPLIARGHTIGAMALVSTKPDRLFTDDDLSLAEEIGRRAALALDSARLYEDATLRALAESALRKAAAAVTVRWKVDAVIQEIARNALVALDASGAFVERVDERTSHAVVVATAGDRVPPNGASTPYEGSFARHVVERGQPERISDLGAPDRLVPRVLTTRCRGCPGLVVPLLREEARGALFFTRAPGAAEFNDDEVERAAIFGELAGLAFRKAYLLELAERGRAEAEAATRARDEVLAVVSHDLRNPVHTIMMATALLGDSDMALETTQRHEQLEIIKRSAERMNRLIQDLLDVSRIESGRFTVKCECEDPLRIAEEAFKAFQRTAEARQLRFRKEISGSARRVHADRDRILQALGNFLDNALKFSPNGSEIVLSAHPNAEDTGVQFSVRDSGPGIAPEVIGHVFDRGWQERSTAYKGAGLGLAIAKGIAEAHHGRAWVESTVGRGSTFHLWLPYSRHCA